MPRCRDGAGNAANLSLSGLTQGSPQIDTTPPTVSSVAATAGDYPAGNTLSLTLNMSENVTVTGKPTLTLNDGGTASYVSGSGTNALTFSYTVAAGQNAAALEVTAVNGTIADLAGNALSTYQPAGTFTAVIYQHRRRRGVCAGRVAGKWRPQHRQDGHADARHERERDGQYRRRHADAGLDDGGTATYVSGSGGSALTFSYTVARQNVASYRRRPSI